MSVFHHDSPSSCPELSAILQKLGKPLLQAREILSQGPAIGDGMDEADRRALHGYITPFCRRLRNPEAVTIT